MAARFGDKRTVNEQMKKLEAQGAEIVKRPNLVVAYLNPETHDVPKRVKVLSCANFGRGNWSFLYNEKYLQLS